MPVRFPFSPRKPDAAIQPLSSRDAETLTALHGEGFTRVWSAAEFTGLLAQDTVFGFLIRQEKMPLGFVLARLAAGEAEILTIAVARAARRAGHGRRLMDAVLARLHALRAETLFLEVDETNAPAVALYRRLGFVEVGRREAYYAEGPGECTSALVMRRDLR